MPLIMMGHATLARSLGPRWAIGEEDARALAVAWCNWRRHYNAVLDPKTVDLIALISCALVVEGSRITATVSDRAAAKQAAKVAAAAAASAGGQVVDIDRQRR